MDTKNLIMKEKKIALEKFRTIAQVLSKEIRINILSLIAQKPLNVKQIASYLGIPVSTAATNIEKLRQADLINKKSEPGIHGNQKVCSLKYKSLLVNLENVGDTIDEKKLEKKIDISMPVGNYIDCEVYPTCGLAGFKKLIGKPNKASSFYLPERMQAHLVWAGKSSKIEYRFPFNIPLHSIISSIEISCELCSESPNHNEDFPSDISLWVNDVEVGTWTSPGDFGGKRGKFTPTYWKEFLTQYGILTKWKINSNGSYINEEKVSDINIEQLKIYVESNAKPYISIKLGVKEDSEHVNGFNLFGSKFGNYDQNLLLRIYYDNTKKIINR